jgi:hypothetical protein
MAREYAPDEPVAKQREYAAEPTAKAEGDSDLYTKTYKALTEALPAEEGRQRFVGPMLAAGRRRACSWCWRCHSNGCSRNRKKD